MSQRTSPATGRPARLPGEPEERGERVAARVTALAALVLAGAAWALGAPGVVAVAALMGLGIAMGWGRMLDLPSPRGTQAVLVSVVVLGVVAALLSWSDGQAFEFSVWWALPVAGGVWASLAHQVWRRDGRPRVVDVLTAEVFAVLVVIAGFLWSWSSPAPALATAAGVAATGLVDSLFGRRRLVSWGVGVLVALGVAASWWWGRGASSVDAVALAGVAVLGPTVSQAARLVLLRLPAVRSGASGGVVAGLVSASLAGIVTGLFAIASHVIG